MSSNELKGPEWSHLESTGSNLYVCRESHMELCKSRHSQDKDLWGQHWASVLYKNAAGPRVLKPIELAKRIYELLTTSNFQEKLMQQVEKILLMKERKDLATHSP